MSRGFWAAIGAIAGFFIGGFLGAALGMAWFHSPDGAGDVAAIGDVVGIICGFAIAWFLAGRRQRPS